MSQQRTPSPIDTLAEDYFQNLLNISPELATAVGMPGADQGTLSDYSPAGIAQIIDLARSTLLELEKIELTGKADAITAAALRERLGLDIELYEAGESIGEINVIDSPIQGIRDCFDLMPTATAADWETISRRLASVPQALTGYSAAISARINAGPPIAKRQVLRCAEQCDLIASEKSPFVRLASEAGPLAPDSLRDSVKKACESYGQLAHFLRETVLPHAVEADAVGPERYARFSRVFLGAAVDLDETYEWGKVELARIIAEQEEIAVKLYGPGTTVREAMDKLNADPERQIHGTQALRTWMQRTADAAMDAIAGTYFDVPEPLKHIECMVQEDGTGGIYYTGPTDDFSRPGQMWWSVPSGVTDFAAWQEKTTVYHEGVPGHHLQVGLATFLQGELNNWRRQGCWVSGHGEGWALYAEQLMAELGFHEDLGDRFGVLDSMRLRAARVVVDLGVHLGKPAGKYGPGVWDHESAWAFLRENVAMDPSFLSFELDRYLGWPGQAPSYKIGQRIWNDLRESARNSAKARGEEFDMLAWHMDALSIGSVGLDVLREALK